MQERVQHEQAVTTAPSQDTATPGAIAVQLGLSHLIAGGVALGVYFWMIYLRLQNPYPLLIALITACVTGLFCTLNLQYGLYLFGLSLARLARGMPGERIDENGYKKPFVRLWPLSVLFQRLEEAAQSVRRYAASAQLTADLREKMVQQASEAAALAERNRIARELHDSIKQQIFSISVSAAAAKALWQDENAGEVRSAVEDIQHSAREAQVEMQALLQQLRPAPLENTSLVEALRVQAQALGFRTGAVTQVEIDEMPGQERLLPGMQEAIFRLVQEAFANIARHARAHTIWLKLKTEEHALRVEVRDDGQGFDMAHAQRGMGLNNLRERARELHGKAEVSSQPGQGTSVVITLPLLEALRSPEEEARQRYELARANELARRGYQLCETASIMGIVLVALVALLSIHWSVLAFTVLVVAYGYASGVYYRAQVALNAGQESRTALELKQIHRSATTNLNRLLGLCLWYIFARVGLLDSLTGLWLLALVGLGLSIYTYVSRRRSYPETERYYRLLSHQEVRWDLERRRQIRVRSITFWLVLSAAGLVINRRLFRLPPTTTVEWTAYGVALIALLVGISIFSDYFQIQRWRRTLDTSEQHAEEA